MFRIRNRLLIALAALVGLALPHALLAQNNNNGQNGQRDLNNPQDYQRNEQSQGNQQNMLPGNPGQNGGQLTGTVQSYRETQVNGTPHFRVNLKTANGSVETVDLGPTNRADDLINNIEEGDRISVQGQPQKINGKSVFAASQARVLGKSYRISQANAEAGSNGSEQNGQESYAGQQGAQQGQQGAQQGQQAPNAVVLLDERFVFLGQDELDRHLILAKENLRMGDKDAAAGELRVAADHIDMYANSAQGRGKAAELLKNSKQELERLAAEIAKGDNKGDNNVSTDEIGQAAARAQLAVAAFFNDRIQSEQGGSKSIEAGYALQAAATHARQALMWSGENIPANVAQSIRQALRTSDELIAGNQQQAQNVTQVAQNLSQQINQIDQRLGESQAQTAGARQQPNEQNEMRNQQQQPNNTGGGSARPFNSNGE